MTSLFTARRKPKRIARNEPEREDEAEDDSGPVVRRPTTNAPKTKSKLRVSFNPDQDDVSGGAARTGLKEGTSASVKSSKTSLSSAAQNIISRTSTRDREEIEGQDHDRPKYNKAYLEELRNSTPSTPRDLSSRESPSRNLINLGSNTALDIESKFDKAAISGTSSSRIPTAAEIREKKDRRARLAKEQAANSSDAGADFLPLEDYDSDGEFKPRRMQVGSYIPSAREKDTRLIPDDEDMAEGFDEFVEDSGRVTLSRKGQREQTLKEREAIRTMIEEAEGYTDSSGDNSASESDYERHQHYESTQTHHGMDGLASHAVHTRQANRPRQPRETTPIPKLNVGLTRLRDMVSQLEFERTQLKKRRADIERERRDIRENQAHIQSGLEEAGRELERVTKEHWGNGAPGTDTTTAAGGISDTNGHMRGLESFGNTPENSV
ncbi:uncharacterized protein Z518_08202 [Rhinocladiella mackenziei CBS 650.93]|uniref:Rhinocladiella mackenziei CBS 650.93 unplaced genomic scaffold supercont1.6, whole genome shotgun sequence n=1 Tax=Rhinocladiella mackenziei CBS 650.93 TaxID=1442369 RepID=A0A0D2GVF9_9EURO|nr:uncharacterized protein Z518_08202 [Rhinocladiella mackenziei CBS 650.93]KIX02263.1 hypothetical protein Z518_08202 [Rhinocladiella mackenziei CBS 650.93]